MGAPPVGYDTVTLLTDYGTVDEFAGVLRAVIRDLAPHAAVIDLTHDVPPFDVRAGSLTLARAAQYLPSGVVVAVVDPGVGTARRAVAIEVAGGAGVFVGPDNGLLAPAVAMVGGAERAVELTNPDFHLEAPGATFAGRDVFAPVAAHLCLGVPLEELGAPIEPASLLPGVVPISRFEGGAVHAEVLWVDRYGNVQLNVAPEELDGLAEPIAVRVRGSEVRVAVRALAFGELAAGQLGLVTDSYGLAALCLDRSSAADALGLIAGDQVVLEPAGADGPAAPAGEPGPTPVRLRLGKVT